jgi:hypothetical protein
VLQSKTLGYRHGRALGRSSYLQKQLVLLRVQSCLKRSAFTEMQKLAQGKAKICQVSKKNV